MQTASKELNHQEKQSVGLNHTAESTTHVEINVELTCPRGERVMLDVLLLVTQHFFDINNNKLIVISMRGQMLLTERNRPTCAEITTQSRGAVIEVMDLCCP